MERSTVDVECDFCGEVASVATAKISERKADTRTHHRFTTADICFSCAQKAVDLLRQKPLFCKHCPFADFLHDGKGSPDGCPGFEPA